MEAVGKRRSGRPSSPSWSGASWPCSWRQHEAAPWSRARSSACQRARRLKAPVPRPCLVPACSYLAHWPSLARSALVARSKLSLHPEAAGASAGICWRSLCLPWPRLKLLHQNGHSRCQVALTGSGSGALVELGYSTAVAAAFGLWLRAACRWSAGAHRPSSWPTRPAFAASAHRSSTRSVAGPAAVSLLTARPPSYTGGSRFESARGDTFAAWT